MKTKAMLALILAGVLTAGCAVPAAAETVQQSEVTASETGTTTDGWKYSVDDGVCSITGATEMVQGEVTMPGAIVLADGTELPVTKVGSGFRNNAKYITDLTIPASVKVVGDYAFKELNNLSSVKFEGKVLVLGESVFDGCTSLETVVLPEGLLELGYRCFADCTRLTNITLPSTLSTIGKSAFSGCESLKSITIPGKVTEIPENAFAKCAGLREVTIENGVKTIAGMAFGDCDSLEELTIPKSVTTFSSTSGYCIFSNWGDYAANIKSVTIENPDCTFWNLKGTEDKPITVYGYEKSTAEEYCKENGEKDYLVFKTMGEKPALEPIVKDTGLFCDANGNGEIDVADAQFVLTYYVEQMVKGSASWYEITKNPNAPDAP